MNQYIILKHNKIRQLEIEKDAETRMRLQEEIITLENKSREHVQKILESKQSRINEIERQVQEVKKIYPTISAQYEAVKKLHRYSKQLAKEIQIFKKQIIDEQIANRKPRK